VYKFRFLLKIKVKQESWHFCFCDYLGTETINRNVTKEDSIWLKLGITTIREMLERTQYRRRTRGINIQSNWGAYRSWLWFVESRDLKFLDRCWFSCIECRCSRMEPINHKYSPWINSRFFVAESNWAQQLTHNFTPHVLWQTSSGYQILELRAYLNSLVGTRSPKLSSNCSWQFQECPSLILHV
jgi:hypothetical protein